MTAENRKTIKVLVVAPTLPLIGGQAVQAARLVEGFRGEQDFEVDLLSVNPRFFPGLQKIKYLRTMLTQTRYIYDLLTRIPGYDVIHIFAASYYSFLLAPTPAILIARVFGKKTLLNYRSGEAEDHLNAWRRSVMPVLRVANKIAVPSGYLVDVFARFGLVATAVFNFVRAADYRFHPRNPLRPVFLSNRNLEPLYNVSCILRAFAIIQEEFPAAELTVAGDGTEREKLENLAKQLNLRNVVFAGRVVSDEMPSFYDRADIYLNSPNIDNMPNSVIEAFAAGTPVVSTNAGGIPYIVKHEETGLLVGAGDHQALAREAMRVLRDADLAESLISNAREEVLRYSWENARTEWTRLYSDLAGRN